MLTPKSTQAQQAPAPPPPAMTPFSGRGGHSYRVQKPNNSKSRKSNQRAAEYQQRKGDGMAQRLEQLEAELRAAKEEKAEALKKEQMREFIRSELTKPQAELQAEIDKWAARNARKEKEEEEKKRAAEEVLKKKEEQ